MRTFEAKDENQGFHVVIECTESPLAGQIEVTNIKFAGCKTWDDMHHMYKQVAMASHKYMLENCQWYNQWSVSEQVLDHMAQFGKSN